jgi:hypothetical protein
MMTKPHIRLRHAPARPTAQLYVIPDRVQESADEALTHLANEIENLKAQYGKRLAGYALCYWTSDGVGGAAVNNRPTSPFSANFVVPYCAELIRSTMRDVAIDRRLGY